MNWRAKAAVQQIFSAVPGGARLNLLFQRHVTHGLPISEAKLDERIEIALHHASVIGAHAATAVGDAVWFEFGAGWDLSTPLLLYSLGVQRQIVADIRPLVAPDLVYDLARRIRDRALRRPFVRAPNPGGGPLDAYLAGHGIDYRAPLDARATGLPPGTVDFVTSTNTLEHIPPDQIEAILVECRRILSPGGLVSVQIDYQDHYSYFDASISPYHFLRYEDQAWRRYNPTLHYQNRLRHRDHLGIIAAAGFEVVAADTLGGHEADVTSVAQVPLASRFRGYEAAELAIRRARLLLRPVAPPGGAADRHR